MSAPTMMIVSYAMFVAAAGLLGWAVVAVASLVVGKLELAQSTGRLLGIAGGWAFVVAFVLAFVVARVDWRVDRAMSQLELVSNARFFFNAAMQSDGAFVVASLIGWTSWWIAKRRRSKRQSSP